MVLHNSIMNIREHTHLPQPDGLPSPKPLFERIVDGVRGSVARVLFGKSPKRPLRRVKNTVSTIPVEVRDGSAQAVMEVEERVNRRRLALV